MGPGAAPDDRGRLRRLAAVALSLVGLAFSAALLVDSLQPVPAFCAAQGCAAVRATAWARPLGIPLPAIGLAFFGAGLALTAAGPRAARARTLLALAGGAGGLGFLALQAAVIGAWCRLCVVVDSTAIASAVLVAGLGSRSWRRAGGRAVAATTAVAVAAVLVPFWKIRPAGETRAVAVAPIPGLPEIVVRSQAPGVVTIVDFVDFECPYCRALHTRLVQALARVPVPVRVVRKMVPLPQHPGALPAAIAWCCADAQGRGDQMAEALMAAPISDLTGEGCERIASEIGLDLARYRRDASDPETRRIIDSDLGDARAAGVQSLPTVYIGREAFVGAAATVDELAAALRRAAAAS